MRRLKGRIAARKGRWRRRGRRRAARGTVFEDGCGAWARAGRQARERLEEGAEEVEAERHQCREHVVHGREDEARRDRTRGRARLRESLRPSALSAEKSARESPPPEPAVEEAAPRPTAASYCCCASRPPLSSSRERARRQAPHVPPRASFARAQASSISAGGAMAPILRSPALPRPGAIAPLAADRVRSSPR